MKDKTKKKVLIILILFTILEWLVGFYYRRNMLTISEKLGEWAEYATIVLQFFPVLIVVTIIFLGFMRRNQKKAILWSILWAVFVIINSKVAILVFLLFFLDGKFTTEESQKSLADPTSPDDDKKLGENKE